MGRWFYHLSTWKKLALGFAACLISLIITGAFSISQLRHLQAGAEMIVKDPMTGGIAIGELSSDMRQVRIHQYQLVLATGNTSAIQQAQQRIEDLLRTIDEAKKSYESSIHLDEDRQNFQSLNSLWQQYTQHHERLLALVQAGKQREAADYLNGEMTALFREQIQPLLEKMIDWNHKTGDQIASQAHRTYRYSLALIIGMMIAAVLLSAFLGWFISRYITGALNQMAERMETLRTADIASLQQAMHALGNGDLTATVQSTVQPIALDTRDEFGRLAKTFNTMLQQLQATMDSYRQAQAALRDAVAQVVQNAHFVASTSQQLAASTEQSGQASNEIARGSEQLAQQATEAAQAMDSLDRAIRTVQQGSEAQREAAQQAEEGMRQAAKAVEEVARSAQQMAASAQQASAIAQQGGQSVEEMLQTMRQIQEQAEASAQKVAQLDQLGQQIGNIVQTIEQIAEQTNLLALNAAIEAARAGEHGRGFAVVADEVRKLAEQAGAATKEIATLIGNVRAGVEEAVRAMQATSQQVSDGFARSEQVGSALVQIVESAQQVAGEVQSVTAVAEEMSASVQQVLATVSTVLQSAEENARAALEMASGAEQVSSAIASVASISEEAAASAEELNASSEEVAAAAQELASMAQQLQQLVSRFRYEEGESRPQLRLAA